MPFPSIGGGIVDIVLEYMICTIINCLYSPQESLTMNVPPVMRMFLAFGKKPEPESSIWQLSTKVEAKRFKHSQRYFVLIPWILAS